MMHGQTRVDVGDEQHARAVVADLGDAAGQALAGDHCLAMRHTGASPDIEQRAAYIGAHAVAHDAGGDEGGLRAFAEIGQAAQAFILVLEPARRGLPGEQAGILLAQPGILLAQRGEFLEVGDGAVGGGHRAGDGLEDGTRKVERQHAGILDQDGVGLADQHCAERGKHEQAQGEALYGCAHLASGYLEVVPDRHAAVILLQEGATAREHLPMRCFLTPHLPPPSDGGGGPQGRRGRAPVELAAAFGS